MVKEKNYIISARVGKGECLVLGGLGVAELLLDQNWALPFDDLRQGQASSLGRPSGLQSCPGSSTSGMGR